MYFCSNSGWSFFITYAKPYLENDLGLSGWTLHFAAGAPLLCGGFGCLLGGLLTDRLVPVLGRRWGRTSQGLVAYALGGGFFLFAVLMTGNNNLVAFAAICLASFVKDFAMAPWLAGALSYGAGLALIYALSIHWVFKERTVSDPRGEFVLFAALGLVGLVLNSATLSVATALGLALPLAKGLSAGIGFTANFISRKVLLFSGSKSGSRS